MKRLLLALLLLWPTSAFAQNYTLAPEPYQTVFDNNGLIVNGACVWTYVAGTTTPIATYQDTIGTANTNPIVADSAGRFTAFLVSGASYKFVFENVPCAVSPPTHGPVLRTADNINAVPSSSATVDISTALAGESIGAGQCAYLSDGSGAKIAGSWYKCDSTNGYSSTLPEAGLAIAAIANGATGTVRLAGSVTGLSALSVGSEYFVGASGAITSTAPGNRRHLGHADTANSLVLTADPAPSSSSVPLNIVQGRLSLTSGLPVTTADVTAATTVYWTCGGSTACQVTLYDGANWNVRTFTELSIAVPNQASIIYDVVMQDNGSSAPTLVLLQWTNDTTRSVALVYQNGVLEPMGNLTKRYMGTFRTTTVSGQTEDSAVKRYVYNYYNRALRQLRIVDATASWAYTTAAWRQANANAANQADIVVGWQDSALQLFLNIAAANTAGTTAWANVGIGEDSTTVPTVSAASSGFSAGPLAEQFGTLLLKIPAVGRHFYSWMEAAQAAGTMTWYGTNSSVGGNTQTSQLTGVWFN